MRHGNWKLQITSDPTQRWLFKLDEDPTKKQTSLTPPQKVAELMNLLSEHNEFAREPLYPSVAELAVKIDKTLNNDFEEGDRLFFTPINNQRKIFFRSKSRGKYRKTVG